MSSINFERAIERYTEQLAKLEAAAPPLSAEQVLEVLAARDAVHRASVVTPPAILPAGGLAVLPALDKRLKKKSPLLFQQAKLADWRACLHPPPEAWWWYLDPPDSLGSRFRWVPDAIVLL